MGSDAMAGAQEIKKNRNSMTRRSMDASGEGTLSTIPRGAHFVIGWAVPWHPLPTCRLAIILNTMNGAWNAKLITEVLVIALLAGGGYWYLSGDGTPSEPPTGASAIGAPGVGETLPNGEPTPPTPVGVTAIVSDTESGREYLANQLIVGFHIGTSPEDAMKVIESVDGVMLQRFTNVPLFLISVPDTGDGAIAARAMAKLKRDSRVETVEFNYVTTLSGANDASDASGGTMLTGTVDENAAPEEGAAQ